MFEELADLFQKLPTFLGGHLLLSLSALAVGLAVSLPLGVLVSRRPRLAEFARGAAGVIQTVPSLALLALLVPLLGGMIGFVPAFVALTLYSILPILVNTVVGLREIDPTMIEVARGLGMSEAQMLWRVQLPLAAPVILAGIRTATVLVVGTATLATPVGETTLGNYIFVGLEMLDTVSIVFGCVFAALLAITLDQLIRLLEVAVRRRSRTLALVAVGGLLLVILGGLARPIVRLLTPASSSKPVVTVGSAGFTEQHILSEVLREHLEHEGFPVEQRQGMGKMIMFEALRRGQIDCCVDYTGSLWAVALKHKDIPDDPTGPTHLIAQTAAAQMFAPTGPPIGPMAHLLTASRVAELYAFPLLGAVTAALDDPNYGIQCLGSLGFQNAFALAMPKERAESEKIKNITGLSNLPKLTLAGDLQFFGRPEWTEVCTKYPGLKKADYVSMDASLMLSAKGVDAVCVYTTDARIDENTWQLLPDNNKAFLRYDAVILVSPKARDNQVLVNTLKRLLVKKGGNTPEARLEEMRRANGRVDQGEDQKKWRPREAAQKLLPELLK